jgi:chromosome segregation ATPase
MAAAQPNDTFLQQFDESMKKLKEASDKIMTREDNEARFNQIVIQKLGEINQKIKDILVKVNEMRAQLDGLKQQVTQNNTAITSNNAQLQEKNAAIQTNQQQIQNLTAEREGLLQQLQAKESEFRNVLAANDQEKRTLLQQKDDADRELGVLREQSKVMQNDLSNRIDQQQHAQAIQQLEQRYQAEVETIQKQLDESRQESVRLNSELRRINEGIAVESLKNDETIKKHEEDNRRLAADMVNIQQQNQQLQQRNEDLRQRIALATSEMLQIIENINKIDELAQKRRQNSATLIPQLTKEIEESIGNISHALQGQPQQPTRGGRRRVSKNKNTRKKRRIRNQRGGFEYNPSNKRKSIETIIFTKKRNRKHNKSSRSSSFYNSSPKSSRRSTPKSTPKSIKK